MNNRAQGTIILIIVLCLAFLMIVEAWAITGSVTKDSQTPKLEVLNPEKCLNKEDSWGINFKVDCELEIKNLEQRPVELNPTFECYKLSDPYSKSYIEAGNKAIVSGGQEKFKVSYDNDGREWSCRISSFGITKFN